MLIYCLKYNKNAEDVDSKALKTKNGSAVLWSKCTLCGNKKSRFMKK